MARYTQFYKVKKKKKTLQCEDIVRKMYARSLYTYYVHTLYELDNMYNGKLYDVTAKMTLAYASSSYPIYYTVYTYEIIFTVRTTGI